MSKLAYILSNVSLGPRSRNSIFGSNDQHVYHVYHVDPMLQASPGPLPWELNRFAVRGRNGCLNAQMHKLAGKVACHTCLTFVQSMTRHKVPWFLLLEKLCSIPGNMMSE